VGDHWESKLLKCSINNQEPSSRNPSNQGKVFNIYPADDNILFLIHIIRTQNTEHNQGHLAFKIHPEIVPEDKEIMELFKIVELY